jgi:hypothetical protein
MANEGVGQFLVRRIALIFHRTGRRISGIPTLDRIALSMPSASMLREMLLHLRRYDIGEARQSSFLHRDYLLPMRFQSGKYETHTAKGGGRLEA